MKNKLKMISCAAIGFLAGSLTIVGANQAIQAMQNTEIKVSLNGQIQEFKDETTGETQYPITYNNRTYLPLRNLSELLGFGVEYNNQTNTAELMNVSELRSLLYGETYTYIDNENKVGEIHHIYHKENCPFIPRDASGDVIYTTLDEKQKGFEGYTVFEEPYRFIERDYNDYQIYKPVLNLDNLNDGDTSNDYYTSKDYSDTEDSSKIRYSTGIEEQFINEDDTKVTIHLDDGTTKTKYYTPCKFCF